MGDTERIRLEGVTYRYPDGTAALTEINLSVRAGEFVGLLGANGSGKTTLLQVADGILKCGSGRVLLDGMDISSLSPKDIYRRMGLVFQNPDNQLFASTVAEDVAFGPVNMGCKPADVKDRVARALRAVEMEELGGKPIGNLSFGQKKRACIAGLLAMGHEILLLDEPTAGLDPMGEYRMMGLLRKLNTEQGVTILMATHSVDMVPLFLSRLFIMSRGEVKRGGTPEEVFTAPKDMADVKLRLPHIAELIHELRHRDNIDFRRTPLTVGEARRMILEKIENREDKK